VREIVKEELELNSCNEPMAKKIVEEVIAGEGKNLQTEHNAWKRQPTSLLNFEVYDFMCSSTIFLHLILNHIVSDFDNISCSVLDFFRHFIQKCSLQVGIPTVLHLTPRIGQEFTD
jgi:hypothetical protein